MDPIADMFTRIRNAYLVSKSELSLPMSKLKFEVAKILKEEGWISDVEVVPGGLAGKHNNFDELLLKLRYKKNGKPQISSIKKVSKPGLKVYVSKSEIPTVLNNFGTAIISTSLGVMTGKEAISKKVGGEVIGEIY